MKKIDLSGLEKTLFVEKLENGLEVFLVPYSDKKDYFINYVTRYGSDVLKFKMGSEVYTPPLGVAHYLEHKMFEQESGEDPFTYFSCSGTESNASTSYEYTQYICYGTKRFADNLRYLIHFVNKPYFTNENVEKEKRIISEEINMYQDYPDYKLEMCLRSNLFHKSSRKYDIAGTVKDIEKITKEDLYKCYNSFYVPNNMFLLVVGNFDKDDAIAIIKSEFKYTSSEDIPKVIVDKEEKSVVRKKEVLYDNIEVPKIAFGLKIPKDSFNLNNEDLDLYLSMITTILFGASSEFRERVRSDKILNDISMDWEDSSDYKTFYLMASTIDPDKLINEIQYEIDHISIAKNTFERIKKVWIANEVKLVDNIERMDYYLLDDIVHYGKVIPNRMDKIKKMSLSTLNDLIKKIDFRNQSIVKMLCKEKKEDIN